MSNVVLNILSEFKGKKAFKDADKALRGLGVRYALTTAGALAFTKASVQAFIADEAAANKLSNAVKNLGMEFANPYITEYIASMETLTKVADDELRPAFQILIQQTGSLAASQSALSTAIEVSRGSGESLATVANDLAQAYVGNTKGLKKYYLGLSNATLQAKSFTEIQQIMNNQFAGSSAQYLSTYSGQVGVLSLAWGNFQEKVGGTLLTLASFGSGAEGNKLNLLAATLDKIGSAIELIGKGKEAIFGLFDITGPSGILSGFNPYRAPTTEKKATDPTQKYAKELAKIEADRKKQNAAIVKSQKQLTAEQKKQAALKKAGTIFDQEQINLIAALKKNISDEDRKRAELQIALATENVAVAQKLTYELAKAQGLGEQMARNLATLPAAKNPFEAWAAFLDGIEAKVNRIAASANGGGGSNAAVVIPPTNAVQDFSGFAMPTTPPSTSGSAAQFGSSTPWAQAAAQSIYVQIDGKTIATALQDQSLSGISSKANRMLGMFGDFG